MLRSRLQLREKLKEKLVEALQAVLPIVAIVLVLSFFIAPLSPSVLLCFLLGAVMIIFGMMFFTLGAEMSMTPMGERVGSAMTKSRSLPKMIVIGFILGFIITISEPDLQVLANQVPSVPNLVLILSVAAGVGAFLVIALLRMLFSMALPPLLVTLYAIVFVLAAFVPKDFLAVAFDSGGVTTGPMTVPFIMALGVGISAIRSDRHARMTPLAWLPVFHRSHPGRAAFGHRLQPRRKAATPPRSCRIFRTRWSCGTSSWWGCPLILKRSRFHFCPSWSFLAFISLPSCT